MNIDVQAVQTLFVERLTDPAIPEAGDILVLLGDTTRDGTTSKANSVIHARHLTQFKPTAPFIAYRWGPVVRRERIIQTPVLRLIIYDEPAKGYYRINTIVPLISRALLAEPKLALTSGALIGNIQFDGPSGETTDDVLNLLMRYMTVAIDAMW